MFMQDADFFVVFGAAKWTAPRQLAWGRRFAFPGCQKRYSDFKPPLSFFLLSVTYQPLPLNTMPAGWMSRRTWPAHSGQCVSGLAEKLCTRSNRTPHLSHR
jgi:hypothetical protein